MHAMLCHLNVQLRKIVDLNTSNSDGFGIPKIALTDGQLFLHHHRQVPEVDEGLR